MTDDPTLGLTVVQAGTFIAAAAAAATDVLLALPAALLYVVPHVRTASGAARRLPFCR